MNKDYDFLFNIILVGDSCTGKSCILSQYTDNVFKDDISITIGFDFKIKTINLKGKTIKIKIMDTSVKEQFRNIYSGYFNGAHGIILVYDITNKDTFKNINEWILRIKYNTQRKNFNLLVGNKCDMKCQREVSKEEGKQLAEDNNMIFFEASAKTGENINQIFNSLAIQIINSELESEKKLQSEKPQIKKEDKSIFSIFYNLIYNDEKEKEELQDDKINNDNKEIDKLNFLLIEEKNESLSKK